MSVRTWVNLFIVYLVWGSTYLATAVLVETWPPLAGSGLRFLLASLLLAVYIIATRGTRALRVQRVELGSSVLIGVLLLSVGIGTLSLAVSHVPTGLAALLVATIPLWAVIIQAIGRRRPRPLTLAGVIIGLIGVALILLPGGTQAPQSGPAAEGTQVALWSLALLGSSIVWAFGSWLSPRLKTPSDTLVMTLYQMLTASTVLIVIGMLRGERFDFSSVSLASWLGLAYLVVFGSLIAYNAFTWLIAHASLSFVTTYAYVNPAVAVLLGFIVFGEALTTDVWIGLTVVLSAVALVVSGERVRRARFQPPQGSASSPPAPPPSPEPPRQQKVAP